MGQTNGTLIIQYIKKKLNQTKNETSHYSPAYSNKKKYRKKMMKNEEKIQIKKKTELISSVRNFN